MNQLKKSRILTITAAGIFILSLFTPYRHFNSIDYSTGVEEFEAMFPFMSLWIVAPLTVLALINHTQLSKWLMVTFSLLLFVSAIPIQYVFFSYSKSHIVSKPGVGFYLLVISAIVFMIAAILKRSVPADEKPGTDTNTLENF